MAFNNSQSLNITDSQERWGTPLSWLFKIHWITDNLEECDAC
ncbi:hypothetical protein pRL70056 (plasmid) [Rhizobium johnstonii 3841]|uniref:Uncharacterized protein n=1 Tax=Rhizobium johnstonii (strain DSM 114642 / LMG 32736 / 3841) TaxID=216596 RepID=Q1M9W1_RHIJ3|nr:hypothetical protein pRL70056 [Rhizobium johnstonii 3841]